MSRSNLIWLLLLLAAGAFLAFTLFQTPPPSTSESVAATSVATLAPTPTALPLDDSAEICTAPVPALGGSIVEAIIGAPLFPNPLLADSNPVDKQLVDLIFDGLVYFDSSGVAQPALAESWTLSDDGRTVTFQLRNDITWHDGQPFDSADVAFTYNLLKTFDNRDRILWESVDIRTPDPRVVAFELEAPYSPFLAAVTRGILPEHILDGVSAEAQKTHPFNNRPIGTGPFVVASDWLSSGYLRLVPNPLAWSGDIGVDAIEIRFFANESARATAFANADIDALIDVAPSDILTVLSLQGARLFSAEQPRYSQLIFNLAASEPPSPVQNETVRRGLAAAIDRSAIVQAALNGQGLPFEGPFVPSSWAAAPTFPVLSTNVTTATALLEEADWVLPEGSDVRIRVTETATETLSLRLLTTDSAEHATVASMLQAQLAQLNAELIWEPLAQAAYREQLQNRAFDLALMTVTPLADPDLYDFWSQDALVNGQNFAAWNNQRASEALEAARQLWDIEERGPAYGAFNREFAADMPALSLYQYVQSYVISERVISAETERPVAIARINRPRDRFTTLSDWRINTEEIQTACE